VGELGVKAVEVVRRVVRRILRREDMVADWSGGIGRENDRTAKNGENEE